MQYFERYNKRIDNTGSAGRKKGTSHPRFVHMSDNIAVVDELTCSQEGQPGWLLQPVKDTSGTALTNVFGAIRTLSHLRDLL